MGKRQLAARLMQHVAKSDRIATGSASVNAYQDAAKPERFDDAGGNRRGLFCASVCRAESSSGHFNLLLKTHAAWQRTGIGWL